MCKRKIRIGKRGRRKQRDERKMDIKMREEGMEKEGREQHQRKLRGE